MNDLHWIRVVACDQLPAREGRVVEVAGRQIAIFKLASGVVAVDNRCPHKGGPLADGIVAGGSVVCPLHAWKVDLETGRIERPPVETRCVERLPTRIEDGVLLIGIDRTRSTRCDGEAA